MPSREQTRSTPRPNRVTPFATFAADPARGSFLGNRGDLHDRNGAIRKTYAAKAWICCTLAETNGQRVTFDTAGHYTPLFFHDEAVALAAGHRPCGQCRRDDFLRFKQAYASGGGLPADRFVPVTVIDADLHAARLSEDRTQRRFRARLSDLSDGVFFVDEEAPQTAMLLWQDRHIPGGRVAMRRRSVMTPRAKQKF